MSDPIPALLLLCACLLVGSTLLQAFAALPKSAAAVASLTLSCVGMLLSLVALLHGGPGEAWALPLGPPGMALYLSVDALAAFFLLLVFLAGGVTVTSGLLRAAPHAIGPVAASTAEAGLVLALLGADAVSLALGLSVASFGVWFMERVGVHGAATGATNRASVWGLFDRGRAEDEAAGIEVAGQARSADSSGSLESGPPGADTSSGASPVAAPALPGTPKRPSALPHAADSAATLGIGLLSAGSLFLAVSLLPSAPPDGVRSLVPLILLVTGSAGLAGLAPFTCRVAPSQAEPRGLADAVLSAQTMPVATYVLIRILFGAETPLPGWWGVPFLLLGAATCVLRPWSAARARTLDRAAASLAGRQSGLVAIGVGLAVMARASDLPDLVDAALGAVLLLAVAQAVCASLAASAAGTIAEAAGTGRIDRLGGLVHAMPVAVATLAAGLFGLTALPLGIGFGGVWLLFHAVLAAPRTDGVVFQALVTLLIAVLAVSGALAAAAFVRILGVATLGRPRLPRVSAAEDAPPPVRLLWMATAGLTAVLGLFPGLVLAVFGDPVVHAVTGGGLTDHGGPLGLSASADALGYAPLPLAALLGIAGVLVFLLRRRHAPSERAGAAWNGGFAPAPAWLPFGDPRTQSDGGGFVPSVAMPPLPDARRLRRPLSRPMGAWAILAAGALLLALLSL